VIATSYDTCRTKTEVTRRVPVHPTLGKILAAWKLSHWERIYSRAPTANDLVVSVRNLTTIDASDAVHAFKADLAALGLRVEAGEHRDRGGHDLRSWFITTCQLHGAHRDLLRVVTHTSKGDVVSGYTRAQWPQWDLNPGAG
jgi:integrase